MGKKEGRKVLAVGSRPNVAKFLGKFLKRNCGDKVKKPDTGHAALKRCRKKPPDLIICLWWRLADMTALEFIRRVRNTPGCEDVPIIVSDMHATPQWRNKLREAGANGYIPAPARPDDVLKARKIVMQGKTYNL